MIMFPNWVSEKYTVEEQHLIFELIKSLNQSGCRDLFDSYYPGAYIVEIAIAEYEAFKDTINNKRKEPVLSINEITNKLNKGIERSINT